MISVVDDKIKSGAPGIGFNFGVGNTNVDHGLPVFRGAYLRLTESIDHAARGQEPRAAPDPAETLP